MLTKISHEEPLLGEVSHYFQSRADAERMLSEWQAVNPVYSISDVKECWRPRLSGSAFEQKGIRPGDFIVHEMVSFVPATTISCTPPYIKGKVDSTWVKYRKDNRPTTKSEWEKLLGMSLMTMEY